MSCLCSDRVSRKAAPLTEPGPVFDQSRIGPGLAVTNRGQTISRTPGILHPCFGLWSNAYDTGRSTWLIRVEKLQGIMFVGCLEEPYTPLQGFARNLVTPAWMLGSYGYVCSTGPHGQEALTQTIKDQLGDNRVGLLSFARGALVRMSLDRDQGTLEIQVCDTYLYVICRQTDR